MWDAEMKLKLSILIIFLIALFGCISTPRASETQANQIQSPTAISTSRVTDENPNTPTVPTQGAHSLDNWEAAKSCIKILSTRPMITNFQGY